MKGTRTIVTPPIALGADWLTNFWRRVNKTDDGCWLWTGATIKGYGQVHIARIDGKNVTWYAHRVAWHLDGRSLVEGLTLDHLCRTPLCVRPDHLEQVTIAENLRRAHPRQTHCKRGHEFTEANVILKRVTSGGAQARTCRTCDNESQRRRAALRKAQA